MAKKPKTLAGQMLELQAAWFVLLAEFCKSLRFPWEHQLRRAAFDRRRQWTEMEQDFNG